MFRKGGFETHPYETHSYGICLSYYFCYTIKPIIQQPLLMTISKTDFIAYLDAPRHLWAMKHNKLTPQEISIFVQHLFNQGYEVEALAEKYIHQYLIPQYGATLADVILQPSYIDMAFEARTDVLIRNPKTNKWDMYEIKSSTEVDKTHKYDATFQYLVFKTKYEIGNVYVLHLNKEYVRKGDIELDKLFIAENLDEVVEALRDEVFELRNEALLMVQTDDFTETIACIHPKDCPCISLCHPDLPEYSIYDVNNLTASVKKIRELEDSGIKSVYDIPSDFQLSAKQSFQVEIAQSKKVYINKAGIQASLNKLVFPLYFLDYETFNPAVPMYDGYRSFDQITFQYSLHVKDNPNSNELRHYEYIETEKLDPINNLLTSLQKVIGDNGSIIVWNKSFEAKRNEEMARIMPEFKEFCDNMNGRIFDLMEIFRDQLYCDPQIKGSYSIKKVLPSLVRTIL